MWDQSYLQAWQRWFKWEMPNYWPKTHQGLEYLFFSFNPFQRQVYAAWHQHIESVYPHTTKYRLIKAICDNDLNEAKLALDKDPSLIRESLYDGFLPLTLASSLNRTSFIHYFLLRGAEINELDEQGRTPLIHAVLNWQIDSIKLLTVLGANVLQKGSYGYDAKQLAEKKGQAISIQTIIVVFLEVQEKQRIRNKFPSVQITYDFQNYLRRFAEDIFQNRNIYDFNFQAYPFNDYAGQYQIHLIDEKPIIQ